MRPIEAIFLGFRVIYDQLLPLGVRTQSAGIAMVWNEHSTLCRWHCTVLWAYAAIAPRGLPSLSLVLLSLVVCCVGSVECKRRRFPES